MGIFSILEEECMFPKATDQTFLSKLHSTHDGKHPNYTKPKGSKVNYDFELGHYAGNVGYSIANWLDKNKDPINEAVATLLGKSSDTFVADMFKEYGGDGKFFIFFRKLFIRCALECATQSRTQLYAIKTRLIILDVLLLSANDQKR